jgi:hypothetical protein
LAVQSALHAWPGPLSSAPSSQVLAGVEPPSAVAAERLETHRTKPSPRTIREISIRRIIHPVGNWLGEAYRITRPLGPDDIDDDDPRGTN